MKTVKSIIVYTLLFGIHIATALPGQTFPRPDIPRHKKNSVYIAKTMNLVHLAENKQWTLILEGWQELADHAERYIAATYDKYVGEEQKHFPKKQYLEYARNLVIFEAHCLEVTLKQAPLYLSPVLHQIFNIYQTVLAHFVDIQSALLNAHQYQLTRFSGAPLCMMEIPAHTQSCSFWNFSSFKALHVVESLPSYAQYHLNKFKRTIFDSLARLSYHIQRVRQYSLYLNIEPLFRSQKRYYHALEMVNKKLEAA